MKVRIEASWESVLQPEFDQPYFKELTDFVRAEYAAKTIYPPAPLIFNAFDRCPFHQVKVVIIGQDPYHGPGQAHGLCFSVPPGVEVPPSLVNIYKELERDLGIPPSTSGDLTSWAKQGVLLLNATLTVEAHKAGSHQNKGWELFTDGVIHRLAEERRNLVFMLWGSYAQRKGAFIPGDKHLVLKSVHPSPLSAYRGFIGCGHFSQTNRYLVQQGRTPIEWKL
ncbi:MAG: uracil-DNA glycosylase [Paludibacter sp. 47-17]|nr:MAG: uracil-DNA glycosylase [Paludibacter sp. 47-17]